MAKFYIPKEDNGDLILMIDDISGNKVVKCKVVTYDASGKIVDQYEMDYVE